MTRHLDPRHLARSVVPWLAALALLGLAGCGWSGGSPEPVPSGTCASAPPVPGATPGACGGTMTDGELRLVLIRQLGQLWYCDPDSYPVGRDEQQSAIDRFPEMVAEDDLFRAVARQLGIDRENATDSQKLALYRLWKMARAVSLEPIGDGRFRFDYLVQPAAGAAEGERTAGIIDDRGTITIEQQAAAGEPMCPICLAVGTLIETPDGAIAVDRLRLGDTVWTLDQAGRRVRGTVVALGSMSAPPDHQVIRLTLADGRSVTASPGHPLADGRTFADLRLGDPLDGSAVRDLDVLTYAGAETFDLAVSGETGIYLAGGIALRSTLDPSRD